MKNKCFAFFIGVVIVQSIASTSASACTVMRVSVGDKCLVARNHDWPFGDGLMVINQRGVKKTAMSPIKPANWVSKYGSVSLTQFGREIPFAGMNEVGLTVDLLQLLDASFPVDIPKQIHTVNVIQWVQFQLDTSKSVREVIASLDHVVPMPMIPSVERVHYFVTDASGDVAVIEFLGGKAVIRHGNEKAICALANSTWKQSKAAFDSGRPKSGSEARYLRAIDNIARAESNNAVIHPIDFAFESLRSVSQGELTQWSLVYQPQERRIWLTTKNVPHRRWIDLDDFSFAPETPTKVLDLDANYRGNLYAHFKHYKAGDNHRIVNTAFDRFLPPGAVRVAIKQVVLTYPETMTRVQP